MRETPDLTTAAQGNSLEARMPQLYLVDKKKKSRYQVHLKSFLMAIFLIILVLLELFRNGSYIDEAFSIVATAYLIVFNKKMNKYDIITYAILIIISVLGFLSNWYSGVDVTTRSIVIDSVTQIKVINAFFFTKYFLSNKEKQATIEILAPLAKIFTVIAFICSILSQFVNLNMTNDTRYGLKCFNFVFGFNFQYIATFLLLLGSMVCSQRMGKKEKFYFYIMATIAIMMNLKSQALLFGFIFLFLWFILKRFKKINFFALAAIALGIVYLSQYQIDTYLSNDVAARHIFYKYAVKNANTYFPFGSGYATYGSAEASKNYSPLYLLYNFDEVWGMSRDFRGFLTDTYWACVLGQFGWIGMGLMIFVYIRVFRSMTNPKFAPDQKAFLYAAFAQYVIHAIGSGIITSSPGVIGFMAMALFTPNDEVMDKGIILPKVRIAF